MRHRGAYAQRVWHPALLYAQVEQWKQRYTQAMQSLQEELASRQNIGSAEAGGVRAAPAASRQTQTDGPMLDDEQLVELRQSRQSVRHAARSMDYATCDMQHAVYCLAYHAERRAAPAAAS
jgi:hypothetical protein